MKVFQQLETFSTVEFIITDGLCSCFHALFKVQRAANAQCCKTHLHVRTGRTNLCPSSHYMYTSRKATHSLDTCGAFHDNVRPALDLRVASRFGLQLPSSSLDLPRTRSLAETEERLQRSTATTLLARRQTGKNGTQLLRVVTAGRNPVISTTQHKKSIEVFFETR